MLVASLRSSVTVRSPPSTCPLVTGIVIEVSMSPSRRPSVPAPARRPASPAGPAGGLVPPAERACVRTDRRRGAAAGRHPSTPRRLWQLGSSLRAVAGALHRSIGPPDDGATAD